MRAFEIAGNDFYLDEAKSVLRNISHNLSNSLSKEDEDFSPARGLTGQADFLIEAGRILGEQDYRLSAEIIGTLGIDRYKKHDLPWPCGATDGETPGLMTGLAGIGYVYLRLWDSVKVPSLLLL
jgi:lantibiotic biosynthesis protein